jgi:hypothetical protein
MSKLDAESQKLWEELRKCQRAKRALDGLWQAVFEPGSEYSGTVMVFNFDRNSGECYLIKYAPHIEYLKTEYTRVAIYCPLCKIWHEVDA